MNRYKAKKYLEDAMFGNLTKGVSSNAPHQMERLLGSISGNYSNNHLVEAVIGVGVRWDGKLEVALDLESVCHSAGCNSLHEKICNSFYIGSHSLYVYRRQKTGIHLKTGAAVGHESLISMRGYGSAGGLLLSKDDKSNSRLFSNNHVLANTNKGKKGDFIYQYRNNSSEIIGRLENFLPIYSGSLNELDLAVASLDYDVDLYASRYIQPRRARLGERVVKTGASTGTRYGFVTSIDYTEKVAYQGFDAVFINQTQITGSNSLAFSKPGDSGSLIFSTDDDAFVGLLFAGGTHGTTANPADLVYGQLKSWKYVR